MVASRHRSCRLQGSDVTLKKESRNITRIQALCFVISSSALAASVAAFRGMLRVMTAAVLGGGGGFPQAHPLQASIDVPQGRCFASVAMDKALWMS